MAVHLAVAKATKMQRTPIDDQIVQGLKNTADTYLAE
ncbi:aliphatic sulfonate ABC transporter periplasmic substrate-binding protein, partial [Pseudomonas syringae pv. japonica str. M301072]